MSSDDAGRQLRDELQANADNNFNVQSKRPIVKHLNADSSWLLSLPYPEKVVPPRGRCRYNIVIDVWLQGPQVDVFSWFSSQEHAQPSRVQTIDELNGFLAEAEKLATAQSRKEGDERCFIDAVLCSHEFTDHCHEMTLKEIDPSVPVFAPRKAAALISSWKHFENVIEVASYPADSSQYCEHLPSWISVGRVHTQGDGPIYFHSALLVTFSLDQGDSTEALIYTPHGVEAKSLKLAIARSRRINILALLHGLHDVSLMGAQLNLGKENAVKIQCELDVKYWLPTHDEIKIAHGLVGSFLKRSAHTFSIAPGSHPIRDLERKPRIPQTTFHMIGNGQCFVLA